MSVLHSVRNNSNRFERWLLNKMDFKYVSSLAEEKGFSSFLLLLMYNFFVNTYLFQNARIQEMLSHENINEFYKFANLQGNKHPEMSAILSKTSQAISHIP